MSKIERINELAKGSVKVDVKQAELVIKQIERLRANGVGSRGYRLRSPYKPIQTVPKPTRRRALRSK